MTRPLSIVVAMLTLCVVASRVEAQAQTVKGVWRVVAVTGADGKTDTAPQPGLYVFTDRHYSIQRVTASAPRPPLPAQNASEKELAAAFGPYTANSGTYEVKGATLTTKPIVAKNPSVMTGTSQQSELRFESTSVLHVTSTNAAGTGKTVMKLQRLE
jgi:hypothetical protein